ncbi:MAG: hypothetical protein GC134_05675 [Proteobacteria bacterium]|nr:hypothetical protein [Pseudomonadota bacterium]
MSSSLNRHGLALLLGKSLLCIAAGIALYQTGYLQRVLPQDQFSWIWVGGMALVFVYQAVFGMVPYQRLTDREVSVYNKVKAQLDKQDDAAAAQILDPEAYTEAERNTGLFDMLMRIRHICTDTRRHTALDIDRLLQRFSNWHALKARPIHWTRRNLLTYGIIGTYIGLNLATGGAEKMASGEPEAIFAYVVEMFQFLSLAILTTLVGIKLGGVMLNHAVERAERTVHNIANDLSAALYDSGFVAWAEDAEVRTKLHAEKVAIEAAKTETTEAEGAAS